MDTIDRNQFDVIKDKLRVIVDKSNLIHIDVLNKRKRVYDVKTNITGIYTNFICVETLINGYLEKFTISYVDLITKNIIIHELEM